MSFEVALRLTEIIMALCFLQQSAEHMAGFPDERRLYAARAILSAVLLTGIATPIILLGLSGIVLLTLHRFQGPYNGGSDRMGILVLVCVTAAHLAPTRELAETFYAYLAFQLVLSYFISGWVKVKNQEWQRGRALRDVFLFSAYPVSEGLRGWADRPRVLLVMGWAVVIFELVFPLALLHPLALHGALAVAAAFHFSNACFFGLNRFFWIWLSAYPSIIWLQGRLFV
ncbi:HTTM domain-containing protein [Amaricoccus macauensis]|uniref:HTTM domain-containing protein n=1 Tax=Amaricoccus macauensis TaxID=57001 RepID=UPI003C7AE5C0